MYYLLAKVRYTPARSKDQNPTTQPDTGSYWIIIIIIIIIYSNYLSEKCFYDEIDRYMIPSRSCNKNGEHEIWGARFR